MADIEKSLLIKLVTEAKEGNKDSFGELYSVYYDELIRIAMYHSGGNKTVAEDLVQDAMLKAMKNIQNLEAPAAFPKWISKIVVNRCKDYVTSSAVKTNINFSALDNPDDEMEFDPEDKKIDADPAEYMSQKSRDEIVQGIISNLSEEQRAVTLLYYYDDMTISEVAQALGLETSTVIGRLQTAKKNIKNSVTDMQKKHDMKLYGFAPWPFFLWLLGKSNDEVSIVPTASEVKYGKKADTHDNNSTRVEKSASTVKSKSIDLSTDTLKTATVSTATSVGISSAAKVLFGLAIVTGVAGTGYAYSGSNTMPTSIVETAAPSKEDGEKEEDFAEKLDTPATEKISYKTLDVVADKIQAEVPEEWYIEQKAQQNDYITEIHIGDNSIIEIRCDRPDGGFGMTSYTSSGEKKYGNLNFYQIDNENISILLHTNTNQFSSDAKPYDNGWYDYIITCTNVDLSDEKVIAMIASIKSKMECQVKVSVDKLNVRDDFGTNSNIYSVAKKGDTFDVYRTLLSQESIWYQVLVDGKWKWISGGKSGVDYVEVISTSF